MVAAENALRAHPSRVPWLLAAVVVVLASVWSAAWLIVSSRTSTAFDGWLAAEAASGRQWTCPARHVGGYPFAVKLRCERPTYRGEVAGRTADGVLEGLVAGVRLDHPDRLVVRLRGPLNLRSEADDFDLAIAWGGMSITVDGLASSAPSGAVSAARLAVTLQTVRNGDLNLRAAMLDATATPAAGDQSDAAFAFRTEGLVFPTLPALPGLDQPADAEGHGVLSRADLLRAPTRERLDAWRTAGGTLTLSGLALTKGSFHGTASGTLALDDARRPAGRLDTTLAGFEPIAAQFGIPVAGVQLGGLLSSLLGGSKAAPAKAGEVRMPLLLQDGGLFVGPFQTGVRLDPFY